MVRYGGKRGGWGRRPPPPRWGYGGWGRRWPVTYFAPVYTTPIYEPVYTVPAPVWPTYPYNVYPGYYY